MLITWRGLITVQPIDGSTVSNVGHCDMALRSLAVTSSIAMMASMVYATKLRMQRVPFKKMKKEKGNDLHFKHGTPKIGNENLSFTYGVCAKLVL
ncbi:hypothetical protein TNIN_133941 [Trichonephila inaurata madagascariensis]|nr:hypothetical protein TNIN_133941 [Trichonephila inaurata madagascariensis]